MKRRTVRNRPWVWTDDTELDFREWKPDVTDDENYVSISGDNGLWKAKTNDPKLPFVCKVIDNCPQRIGKPKGLVNLRIKAPKHML